MNQPTHIQNKEKHKLETSDLISRLHNKNINQKKFKITQKPKTT